MNILITGATGFVGSHLIREIETSKAFGEDVQIFGTHFQGAVLPSEKVRLLSGNLCDQNYVDMVMSEAHPDIIFHLAALSSAKESFQKSSETIINNLQAQLSIFNAVMQQKLDPKILIVGSGEEYGIIKEQDNPINEGYPLNPVSPYGFSKLAQDLSAYAYYRSYGLKVIRVRPFNHTGPGQHYKFVLPSFAKQIVGLEGLNNLDKKVIKTGNLEIVRDFSDVRDIVKAYVLALQKCDIGGVYNLGSGKGYKIKWLLDKMIELSGVDVSVQLDEALLRPIDIPSTVCNCEKFISQTGWKAEIPIEKTLEDILDYWRKELKS